MTTCNRRRGGPAKAPAPHFGGTLLVLLAWLTPAWAQTLYTDDFRGPLRQWTAELEKGGTVAARGGVLDIDVPAGCTLWFKPELQGAITIQYEARMVRAGGANDRVSDLNAFWMATDARSPGDLFAIRRSGNFADYNQLRTYYVGQGGNSNTTTRFRRYIGDAQQRPLLPAHDLTAPLLQPNAWQQVQLVAMGNRVQYYAGGKLVFDYYDPEPYTHGHFAFRTTDSHIEIRNFRIGRPAGVRAQEDSGTSGRTIPFDAAWLHDGWNEITLGHAAARLEVSPRPAP